MACVMGPNICRYVVRSRRGMLVVLLLQVLLPVVVLPLSVHSVRNRSRESKRGLSRKADKLTK